MNFLNSAYRDIPPWDIESPQKEILRLAEKGEISGRVLDVGCGTGENALYPAHLGFEVWGIDAAIKFFKSRHSGEMMLCGALRLGTGLGESGIGLSISGFKASGWISELFERLSGRNTIEQLPQPDDFVGKLRPYQIKGLSWLAFLRQYGLGACLADDMGLGKTIQLLESFGSSNRLERGRRYARSGQVLDFKLSPGKVTARVQGSMAEPYSVIIKIEPLFDKEWNDVLEGMSGKAIFAARLLAGEMPQNIEEAFDAACLSLFPESSRDIKTDCSCPDSANPCKHIAAVYYILAEEFDRDPFMLFLLRGRTKDDITASLRKMRTAGNDDPSQSKVYPSGEMQDRKEATFSVGNFWAGGELEAISVNISPPDVSAAIIKRLGTPEFWDSKDDFKRMMSRFYEDISRSAIDLAYGEKTGRKKI